MEFVASAMSRLVVIATVNLSGFLTIRMTSEMLSVGSSMRRNTKMTLPKKDFRGEKATITMMELRKTPGEVFDRVENGMKVTVTKQGKEIGIISRGEEPSGTTIVKPNGEISGEVPLTLRRNLGNGGYGT